MDNSFSNAVYHKTPKQEKLETISFFQFGPEQPYGMDVLQPSTKPGRVPLLAIEYLVFYGKPSTLLKTDNVGS